MIKMLMLFVALTVIFGITIAGWRRLNGQEQWRLTKLVAYSIMCMLLTVVVMVISVILF